MKPIPWHETLKHHHMIAGFIMLIAIITSNLKEKMTFEWMEGPYFPVTLRSYDMFKLALFLRHGLVDVTMIEILLLMFAYFLICVENINCVT